jgi:N-acetylglutamate synthase-like GNAT family acetyltransferase
MSLAPECKILRLACWHPDDAKSIRALAKLAAQQARHFTEFVPWEDECGKRIVMYVSIYTDERGKRIICGWMNVVFYDDHAYIRTIVSRARTNRAKFAGTGVRLIAQLEEDTRALGKKYISLLPYGDIEGYYQKLGFQEIELWGTYYMFKPMHSRVRPETFIKTPEYMSGDEIMTHIERQIPREYLSLLQKAVRDGEFQTLVDIYTGSEDIGEVIRFLEEMHV